jgi:regulator of nucleoside diphosphate kinase
MKEQPIIMTWPDHSRLSKIMEEHRILNPRGDRQAFEKLEHELARAQLVTKQDIPADIVTMNSLVQVFDLELGDEYSFTLSWPHEANISENRINVLAPLGMALLGSRVGQEIEWPLPDGNCRLRVDEILFQPENSVPSAAR